MNERKEISVLTTLKEFLGLAIKLHKPYLAALAFSSIILTVQTVFHASQLSILLFYLQKRQFRQALLCGVFLAAVGFCLSAAGKWDNRLLKVHQAKLGETFGHYIFGKVSRIPYFCLEDPECLDLLERARFNVTNENCIRAVLTGLANIVQYVLTLISLAAFLAAFDYRLFGILLIAVFLNIILFRFFSKERLEFSDANVDINRKFVYYTNTLLDYENGKDFRMYRLGGFMKKKFNYFTDKMVTYYNRYLRRTDVIKTLMQVVKYLEMMGIYCFMIAKTIGGGLSVALLTLYISGASNFSTTVSSLIQSSMSFYIGLRLAMPVVQLARLPEETTETEGITLEEFQTLEFRDVVFRYPRSEQKILDHVSFRINKGETISIVGMNGAGKTTLVKLICRLYHAEEGEILVNGIPIEQYSYDSYMKNIRTIFQDFKLFACPIRENIAPGKGDAEVWESLKKVGLQEKVAALPKGIDTVYTVTYEEEGVDFSGGEEQKLALARVLNKEASLTILDEPTAAMDPLAEAEFYQKFHELIQGNLVIYISHRMSSSMFCDKILVLEDGKVSAFDTHQNLIRNQEGLYYKLFSEQAKKYADV